MVRRHLVLKLAVVLLFTIVVGFAVPTVLNMQYTLELLEGSQETAAASIARGLAAGMRNAMLSGNAMTARHLIRDARKSVDGVSMTIFAPNGEEVFAEHTGAPDPKSIPKHVQSALRDKRPAAGPDKARVLPLKNASRCQFCHEHGDMRGVLTLATDGAKRSLKSSNETGEILTRVVTAAYIQLMTSDHAEGLGAYFEEVQNEVEGIEGVTVVDAFGDHAIGNSDVSLPKDEVLAALEDFKPRFVGEQEGKKKKPGRGARFVLPLRNEKRCHSCHDEEGEARGAVVLSFAPGAQLREETLASTVEVGLNHVMLSGLGRLIRRYLEGVASTGAVKALTLHDADGRLYKDAFASPKPPKKVASVLAKGEGFSEAENVPGQERFTYVEPLKNEERCQRCHGADHEVRGAIQVRLDTSQAADSRMRLAQTTTVFGIATVLATLLTLILGLRLLVIRPVSEIGDVADRIALGNLDASVEIRTTDEIGRLGGRVNQMVIELRKKLALSKFVSGATVASIDESQGVVRRQGERRHVTVLFSDIRGFTAFSETREPEQVVEMLNRFLNVQAKEVAAMGGDIDKFVGDELMAHFSREGAERAAVEAGVRMIEAVGKINAEMKAGGTEIAIGVGINCGEVIFGAMGAENRMDFTVIGDAVNLGARLCSAAARHQVLISHAVKEAAGDMPGFVFDALEPIQVKGKKDPIRIYAVRRAT